MTQTEKNKAEKKADTALCKLQDLFYDYNITDAIARKLNDACTAVREVISAIENEPAKRNSKQLY